MDCIEEAMQHTLVSDTFDPFFRLSSGMSVECGIRHTHKLRVAILHDVVELVVSLPLSFVLPLHSCLWISWCKSTKRVQQLFSSSAAAAAAAALQLMDNRFNSDDIYSTNSI